MNKVFCIFPKDITTSFLEPAFNALLAHGMTYGVYGDSSEDEFYEKMIEGIFNPDCDALFFLGHGCSKQLYGNGFSTLISQDELKHINEKTLILFACHSSQLLYNINATKGIGFGFIPSGPDDILDSARFHNLDLSPLNETDWSYLRNAYQKCWTRTINSLNNISDVNLLYKRLDFFFCKAIVETLQSCDLRHKRLISDILFYVKRDMILKS